jgi:hypothetical protein
MVDLSPAEQIQALYQYRTSLQLVVGDDSSGSQVDASA